MSKQHSGNQRCSGYIIYSHIDYGPEPGCVKTRDGWTSDQSMPNKMLSEQVSTLRKNCILCPGHCLQIAVIDEELRRLKEKSEKLQSALNNCEKLT